MVAVQETSLAAANAAMDRYAMGEEEAFGIVYDALAPRLGRHLLRLTRDAARAEDLLQQTFLNMHRARGRFIRGASVMAWAFVIANRLHTDSVRHAARRPEAALAPEVMDACTPELRPDRLLEALLAESAMQETLERLPDNQRLAFEFVKVDGLSLAEAADILGVTVPAVKALTHRAYHALRLTLQDEHAT
jgi:RNA polymerase sigma-70 factor (ECF subfamily)